MIEAADDAVAFRRLHALVGRGCQPDFGTQAVTDAIRLERPGKGLRNVISTPMALSWDGLTREPLIATSCGYTPLTIAHSATSFMRLPFLVCGKRANAFAYDGLFIL
jgi:hypothetical protein